MSAPLDLAEARREIVREVVEDWNPLAGARGHQPVTGEYDYLIACILNGIERGFSDVMLANNIHDTVGMMGVTLEPDAATSISRQIRMRLRSTSQR